MYILNTRIWILNFATIWRVRLWNTFAIQLRGKGQTRSTATNGKCGINYVHYIWQRYFVCSPLLPKQLKNFSLCWWHCLPSPSLSLSLPFSPSSSSSLAGNSERKLWKAVEVVAMAMLAVMTTQAIKNLFIMWAGKSLSGSQPASQLVNSRTVTTKLINFTITERNCECAN